MPELPDVAVFKQYLDATSLHQEIAEAWAEPGRPLERIDPGALRRGLRGRRLEHTRRHGKYLFAELDRGGALVLHFGMTGYLRYWVGAGEPPRHTRMRLDFRNGAHLAYVNQRKLGVVGLAGSVADYVAARELGPDALDPALTLEGLRERAAGRRTAVKSLLMDQSLLAGVGNEYADEVLFQARLDPRIRAHRLTGAQWRRLWATLRPVLEACIEYRADPERMPEDFLLPHRGADDRCPRCGGALEHRKVAGRTAYFCPRCQESA